MALSAAEKAEVVKEYQTAEGDTGSPEVQVALLTVNINKLQGHFKANAKDSLSPKIRKLRSTSSTFQRSLELRALTNLNGDDAP